MAEDDTEKLAQSRVGTVINGKWTVDRLIGVGGMASVYSATHRNSKRAALKIMHPEMSAQAPIRERFLREGYLSNMVDHPGVVTVDDDDVTEDGCAFLVMELVEGENLEARLRRKGPLPPEEVLSFMDQVLHALATAHTRGVVHRDLKPENMLLARNGEVKLLDFGIARARALSTDPTKTLTEGLMGTPAFMPPEQARGRWEEVDAQSDVWSLGATMFTLLTGRNVHQAATTNEALAVAMMRKAPKLEEYRPDLPACVLELVNTALAYEKKDRWPNATVMLLAVRRASARLGDEEVEAEALAAAEDIERSSQPELFFTESEEDAADLTNDYSQTASEPSASSQRPQSQPREQRDSQEPPTNPVSSERPFVPEQPAQSSASHSEPTRPRIPRPDSAPSVPRPSSPARSAPAGALRTGAAVPSTRPPPASEPQGSAGVPDRPTSPPDDGVDASGPTLMADSSNELRAAQPLSAAEVEEKGASDEAIAAAATWSPGSHRDGPDLASPKPASSEIRQPLDTAEDEAERTSSQAGDRADNVGNTADAPPRVPPASGPSRSGGALPPPRDTRPPESGAGEVVSVASDGAAPAGLPARRVVAFSDVPVGDANLPRRTETTTARSALTTKPPIPPRTRWSMIGGGIAAAALFVLAVSMVGGEDEASSSSSELAAEGPSVASDTGAPAAHLSPEAEPAANREAAGVDREPLQKAQGQTASPGADEEAESDETSDPRGESVDLETLPVLPTEPTRAAPPPSASSVPQLPPRAVPVPKPPPQKKTSRNIFNKAKNLAVEHASQRSGTVQTEATK